MGNSQLCGFAVGRSVRGKRQSQSIHAFGYRLGHGRNWIASFTDDPMEHRKISKPHRRASQAYFTEQELKDMGVSESERRNLGTMTQFEQSRRGWEFISSLIAVLFGGSLLVSCCLFP